MLLFSDDAVFMTLDPLPPEGAMRRSILLHSPISHNTKDRFSVRQEEVLRSKIYYAEMANPAWLDSSYQSLFPLT